MADGWVCGDCGREVTVELTEFNGINALIREAASKADGWRPVTAGKATITMGCSCGYVEVSFGPGKAGSAWDFPDGWTDYVEAPDA